MTNRILTIENLSHRYTTSWAVRNLSLEIHKTGILGLLGSNGAGKSTTMNIMCGVLNQTAGNVLIEGVDMRKKPEEAKRKLGFLPQTAPLYLDLTVDEYLTHAASLRLMPAKAIRPAVQAAKDRCGITHFSRRLIKNLSGGYRQRVGIAQAIIHQPKLVVLDEPTNGLDPNQISEVRALIREIASDRAVIFSSHILSEVQVLCHDIVMIEAGEIVFSDTIRAFNNYVKPHSLVAHLETPPSAEVILSIPGVSRIELLAEKQIRIFFEDGLDVAGQLVIMSVAQGWNLKELTPDKTSVEEIFSKLSKRNIPKSKS